MESAVLYLGMGCDSSAFLVDYLETPKYKREFDIKAVISSQTGNESFLIKQQMEECIYPMLAEEKIRTIQIGRKTSSTKDGYVILDDTVEPKICQIRPTAEKPYYTLSDDMLLAGIVPQYAHKKRLCSSKFKKEILKAFHERYYSECVKIVGFNYDEGRRIERALKSDEEDCTEIMRFPWYKQGKTRKWIEKFLKEFFGRIFYRSACIFCPFSMIAGSNSEIKVKYELMPHEAAMAAYLEYIAICFNPKQTLSSSKKSVVERKLLSEEAKTLFEMQLNKATWKIYKIRRITDLKAPYRSVETVFVGTRQEAEENLRRRSLLSGTELKYCHHGIPRLYQPVEGKGCVQFLVAAPGNPLDKERPSFKTIWEKRNGHYTQLELQLEAQPCE